MSKKILVLSPHTDDGELGCGGSIAKFIEEGNDVYYVAFSTAEESVPKGYPKNILEKEVKAATKVLGIPPSNLIIYKFQVRKLNYVRQEILDELIKIRETIKPDMVFLPSTNDLHQDHYTVREEGLRAFKHVTVLGYELCWNNITFHTQAFIKLKKKNVDKKIRALKAYKSQSHRAYTKKDFVSGLANVRGVQIGAKHAETFEVLRWVM
jgi:LmbE family N-acetylglucosaminyl deacetylase